MLIMGIDPGLATTGYGLIRNKGSDYHFIIHNCVKTTAGNDLSARLLVIYNAIAQVIAQYSPDVVAVEELFFNTNVKTALAVGQARGTILLAAAQANIAVFSYTPLQVKQSVVGYGRAEKQQVQQMVKLMLNLPTIPKPDDAADALAIALCHGSFERYNRLVTQ